MPTLPTVPLRDDKFVIHCTARSGSTLLVHLLNSHGRIRCHDEPFGPREVGNLVGSYARARERDPGWNHRLRLLRDRRPVRFLYDCVFDPQGHRAIGFKYKVEEAFQRRHRKVTRALAEDRDIKVVHLVRRDVLAQFVSHQLVLQQTGVTLLKEGEPRPGITPFAVDVRRLLRTVRASHARFRRGLELYRRHRGHQIAYEDLADPRALDDLQAFLGVEPAGLHSDTAKIVDRPLGELILNHDEARRALREAGLEE